MNNLWTDAHLHFDDSLMLIRATGYQPTDGDSFEGAVLAAIRIASVLDSERRRALERLERTPVEVVLTPGRVYLHTSDTDTSLRASNVGPDGGAHPISGVVDWAVADPHEGTGEAIAIMRLGFPSCDDGHDPNRRSMLLTVDTSAFPDQTLPPFGTEVVGTLYDNGHLVLLGNDGHLFIATVRCKPEIVGW